MIIAASSGSGLAEFVSRHPGIILVLVGVVGTVIFEWKAPKKVRDWLKLVSEVVLIVGLAIEIVEAAASDRLVAKLTLQTEQLRGTNSMLMKEIEELRKSNLTLLTKVKPRRINLHQKDVFRRMTQDVPHRPIRVLVGLKDTETLQFARHVRQMLDEAGFGTGEEGIAYEVDLVPREPIQDPGFDDQFYELLAKGQLHFARPFDVELLCVSYPTNAMNPAVDPLGIPRGVDVEYHTSLRTTPLTNSHSLKHPLGFVHFHSTNAADMPYAVSTSLSHVGIKRESFVVTNFVKPGEFAIFIPQRLR